MKIKKILALILVAVMMFTLVTGCSRPSDKKPNDGGTNSNSEGNGDAPIVVKIGHTDSSTRSTHVWSVKLGEYLEEKAPGKFKVEVYPDGQLGDSPDMVAGVKLGTLNVEFDLSSVITSVAGPASSCIDLPYLYPTYEDWIEGTFNNGGLELFNKTIEESGYYCLDMFYNGMRQVISVNKNYHNSDDLKGDKIRIAQNDLNIELWKAMGGNPTPMSWGEVITSLSQGTIDALDHSLGVFNDFSLHEIAPYVTITNHASSPFPVICSIEWLNSLPEDLKDIFVQSVHEICEEQRKEERNNELGYIERFKNEGATVEELTPEEVEAFKESVKPVYDKWREKVGDEVMDAWLETVPKH